MRRGTTITIAVLLLLLFVAAAIQLFVASSEDIDDTGDRSTPTSTTQVETGED